MKKNEEVQAAAQKALEANKKNKQGRQFVLWMLALVVGAALGWLGIKPLNELFTFIATVFTRLFQFIAVPTIALAVITTLPAGRQEGNGTYFCSCCNLHPFDDYLRCWYRAHDVSMDCTGQSSC